MTRKEALTELLEKVERPHAKQTPVVWFMPEVQALKLSISRIARAYNGSMDAALGLFSDYLPGFNVYEISSTSGSWSAILSNGKHRDDDRIEVDGVHDRFPARALLIAILKALIEGEE